MMEYPHIFFALLILLAVISDLAVDPRAALLNAAHE